jgi:hypothetical protein
MDISCYTVTNGQYAVTIPKGTILKPGQYYVLAGQDQLLKECGNLKEDVKVDLNWNTCNCSDKPVPTTGDGFLQNGGNANEKIVLLDPQLNVVDAVSRYANFSSSSLITTRASADCMGHTFDLDNMVVRYESIENSTGIDNSFARRVDGDCGWVKTPAISPGSANKTGSSSSATYDFSTLSASDCNSSTGSISVMVNASNVSSLFPMSYTLGYDVDRNNLFSEADRYTYGVDSSAPSIDINELAYGRYKMTVGSALGCNLQTFDFFIFNCYGIVLPLKFISFNYSRTENGYYLFDYELEGIETVKYLYLEGAIDGSFKTIQVLQPAKSQNGEKVRFQTPISHYNNYRLRAVDNNSRVTYSTVIKVRGGIRSNELAWPSLSSSFLHFQISSGKTQQVSCSIINTSGAIVRKERVNVKAGTNTIRLGVTNLPSGVYQVKMDGKDVNSASPIRFIKQ